MVASIIVSSALVAIRPAGFRCCWEAVFNHTFFKKRLHGIKISNWFPQLIITCK